MRRLRLGMVGGGTGSFIGAVHRIAARLDDRYELVAGAFASDPERARASARELRVAPERAYGDYEAMAAGEAARDDRVDVVAVVTPNDSHVAIAGAFLRAGIAVICDKPLATRLDDAKALRGLVRDTGLPFVLTHNYSGYPMVREARAMVENGALGRIRVVQASYSQDWLAGALEESGQKQAAWRTDPARSGPAGAVGDIGSHAHHLAEFVSGLEVEELLADLTTFVPGRRLDDDARMLLRFRGGARGALWCSQVAPGHENRLVLGVYGERAGIEWSQEHPNQLRFSPLGEAPRILFRGMGGLSAEAASAIRIPAGHPEGYLEGFATLYRDAADLLEGSGDGRLLPGIADGVSGVAFIEAAVASSRNGNVWTRLDRG